MELTEDHSPTEDNRLTPLFYLFLAVPTALGVAHHLDHLVRGNHVGWPVTPEVTAFTFSLAVYPLLAVGLYLSWRGRVGARYWVGFFAASTTLLASVHLGPWAIEPPRDVTTPYGDPLVGALAFGVVVALIGSVAAGSLYGALLWYRGRS